MEYRAFEDSIKSVEKLVKELINLNKIIADCNKTLGAIIQDMAKMKVEGNERDNKNEDSNFEMEQ